MKNLTLLILPLIATLGLSLPASAQTKAYFDQEVSGWASPHLVVDGEIYNLGTWAPYYEIEELFEADSQAEKYAKLHVTHARRA